MKYYRIKKEYDNVTKYKFIGKHCLMDGIYIGNELYTEKEWNKHIEKYLLPAPTEKMTELVNIPKNKTYFFFGCRFAME